MSTPSPVIAVVEDEPRMRIALGRLLRGHGLDVLSFPDGEAFFASDPARQIDALLLDLHLPGMGGFEVLEALQRKRARPLVIIITGNDQPGNAERATALGANSYLLKPVDEAPLLDVLRRGLPGRFPADNPPS